MFLKLIVLTLTFALVLSDYINSVENEQGDGDLALLDPLNGEYKHWSELLNKVNQTLNQLEVVLFTQEV